MSGRCNTCAAAAAAVAAYCREGGTRRSKPSNRSAPEWCAPCACTSPRVAKYASSSEAAGSRPLATACCLHMASAVRMARREACTERVCAAGAVAPERGVLVEEEVCPAELVGWLNPCCCRWGRACCWALSPVTTAMALRTCRCMSACCGDSSDTWCAKGVEPCATRCPTDMLWGDDAGHTDGGPADVGPVPGLGGVGRRLSLCHPPSSSPSTPASLRKVAEASSSSASESAGLGSSSRAALWRLEPYLRASPCLSVTMLGERTRGHSAASL